MQCFLLSPEGLAHSKALNQTEKSSKEARSDRQSNGSGERLEEKARTGAAARLFGRMRRTGGEEAAGEKGRGGSRAGGELESLTHS